MITKLLMMKLTTPRTDLQASSRKVREDAKDNLVVICTLSSAVAAAICRALHPSGLRRLQSQNPAAVNGIAIMPSRSFVDMNCQVTQGSEQRDNLISLARANRMHIACG